MSERTQALISISALHHNLSIVKKLAPNSRVLAMVKSNAYGHGIVQIGQHLKKVDGFGVACIEEAIRLREHGVIVPIVIMSGVFSVEDLHLAKNYNLELVVHDPFQLKMLQSNTIKPINVWLKIDTGMHRLGFAPESSATVYEALKNCKSVNHIKIMTHLADADNSEKLSTPNQLEKFQHFTKNFDSQKSIANSAGLVLWPQSICEWNRPGIMLYGISPVRNKIGCLHELIPVMTLKSKIIAIHDFKAGDAVGYGGCWTCPEEMRVATVAIGYGDGYPRHARNGTPTLIGGKICPLIGRVSMDLISVDLRSAPQAEIGDDVILWGNGLPAEVVAKYADTIPYELVCNVSQRVVLHYRA